MRIIFNLFIGLLLIMPLSFYSQLDKSLLKFSIFEESLDTIKVKAEGYLLENKKIGSWKYYNLNGQLMKESVYMIDTMIYPNLRDDIIFFFNKFQLEKTILSYEERRKLYPYSDSTNEHMEIIVSIDNPIIEYYPNRNLKQKLLKENNLYYYLYYYPDGFLNMKSSISNGDLIGKFWYFYKNGQVEVEGNINNRGLNGPWKKYDENGNLVKNGIYVNNRFFSID